MDINEIISSIAFGIGFVQLYNQVESSEKMGEDAKNVILLGVISSLLWMIYQYRKFGLNISTVYTSIGLIVNLYVLNKVLVKEKRSVPRLG